MDRVQRNGETWQRQSTGEWLKFDVASGQWMSAGAPPPPPPPPPAGAGGPYVPLEQTARRGISLDGLRGSLAGLDRRIALVGGAALLAALLVAGGFAAFGGNDGGVDLAAAAVPVPEPEPMSKKQQFIHDADQICADIMTKANKLPIPTTLEGAVGVMERARSIIMDARSAGRKLNVPKDAHKGWTRMMGTREDVAEFDAVIAALKQGDISALQAWEQENKGDGARDRRWAKRYGMKVCSQELG